MNRAHVFAAITLAAASLLALDVSAAAPPAGSLDPMTVTAARSKADHEAIAAAYEAEAVLAKQKAQIHEEMEKRYRDFGTKPPWSGMAKHCAQLRLQYIGAAKLNRQLAAEHHKLAAKLP